MISPLAVQTFHIEEREEREKREKRERRERERETARRRHLVQHIDEKKKKEEERRRRERERERRERADSTAQPSPARWVVAGAGGIRWTPDGPQTQTDWKSKSRRE